MTKAEQKLEVRFSNRNYPTEKKEWKTDEILGMMKKRQKTMHSMAQNMELYKKKLRRNAG